MADLQSRFTLVEGAVRSPGYDWITRAIQGPFVDTGLDIQFKEFGRLYISIDTIRELAAVAGILEEDKQMGVIAYETTLYNMGYAQALKENDLGQLADILDRLRSVASALDGSNVPVVVEAAPEVAAKSYEDVSDLDDFEPEVFVTDGPDLAIDAARGDETASSSDGVGRQGNGASRKRRPAGVSAGAGDGNPFRI